MTSDEKNKIQKLYNFYVTRQKINNEKSSMSQKINE